MKTIFCFFILLTSIFGFSQTQTKKLENLQLELDKLQYELGNGDDVDHRKINELIDLLQTSHHENDSLKAKIQLLESELALANMKLELKSKYTNATVEGMANSYVKMSKDGLRTGQQIKKGYYVIIESFREIEGSEKQLKKLQKTYPELPIMIVQNVHKTWYHMCIDQVFDNDKIGYEVYRFRESGFTDAWSAYFD